MAEAGAAAVEEAQGPDANAAAITAKARGAVIPDLPRDEVGAVFRFLAGDVESLCRAACVSRLWCAAARKRSLWRELRFSEHPDLARRLTNERLEWLVKRADAALECLVLSRCCDDNSKVTLRGVVRALRGSPPLMQLGLRGLQYGPRRSRMRFEQLRALVRPDGAVLDAVETEHRRFAMCMAEAEDEAEMPCWRLCGVEDEVCTECKFFFCPACTLVKAEERDPPCEHVCDTCFQHPDDDDFFHCERCDADEVRVVNGNCHACMSICAACNKLLCNTCAIQYHGLAMCHSGGCEFGSYEQYCDDCIYPDGRVGLGKLHFCSGRCRDLVCERCMDLQTNSFCAVCEGMFCRRCRDTCLTVAQSNKHSQYYDDEDLKRVCEQCKKGR